MEAVRSVTHASELLPLLKLPGSEGRTGLARSDQHQRLHTAESSPCSYESHYQPPLCGSFLNFDVGVLGSSMGCTGKTSLLHSPLYPKACDTIMGIKLFNCFRHIYSNMSAVQMVPYPTLPHIICAEHKLVLRGD